MAHVMERLQRWVAAPGTPPPVSVPNRKACRAAGRVSARVDGLDLEHVLAASKRSAVPVGSEPDSVAAVSPGMVLARPRRVDAVEAARLRDRAGEVDRVPPVALCA